MGRAKVELKKIEDKARRQTTFTKRRQGLFKKATEFCQKCNAQVMIIAFSNAGNVYAYGDPHVDIVMERYDAYSSSNNGKKLETLQGEDKESNNGEEQLKMLQDEYKESNDGLNNREQLEALQDDEYKESTNGELLKTLRDEYKELTSALEIEESVGKILEAVVVRPARKRKAVWNETIEDLGLPELEHFDSVLEKMKKKVVECMNR